MAIFDPLYNRHPLTDHQKFVTANYFGVPYVCAKFGAHPSTGASGRMGEIWPSFLFMPFFWDLPTGKTRRRIFVHDGSNDAD